MFENETPEEDPTPNSKPPYLFLIPVALGIVAFIGYQTVHMGMGTSVVRSSYTDTSLVQADVQNGVITVHAHPPAAQRPVRRVAMLSPRHAKAAPKPSGAPLGGAPSAAPSAKAGATPAPTASPTKTPEKTTADVAHKSRHAATRDSESEQIAAQPVPQIERPIAAHLASNVSQNSSEATAPPITDAPIVHHEAPAEQAAPPATAQAKPVQVAQAPAAPAQAADPAAPVNASDRIVDAKMRYAAAPEYPDMARDEGVRGTSVVFVTVDPKGAIVHMSIASSSGNGSLDRAALAAARSSQYVAPKVDGKPATETYRVTYDFAP